MARSRFATAVSGGFGKIGLLRVSLLAIAGLSGAWLAFIVAVSGVTRTTNPQLALTFLPNDSMALAARAEELFLAEPEKPSNQVRELALSALRQQPINPKALRLLGYAAEAAGDTVKAEAYFRQAEKLTRRDPVAQLWLIENAVQKGDTKQALVHYDIALRTSPPIQELLFPNLLAALDDTEIRAALRPYVRAQQGWAAGFLSYANANGKDLPALTSLILESGGLADPVADRSQRFQLMSRLISERYFAEASRLYFRMPGARKERLTDAGFDSLDQDGGSGPMGWQIIDDPDAGGGFAAGESGQRPTLSVFANSSTTRTVATKLLYLVPGSYVFSTKLAAIERGDGGFLRWQLTCASGESAAPLWSFDTISSTVKAQFAVPPQCNAQRLDLIVSGGKGQTGLEATIAAAALSRSAE